MERPSALWTARGGLAGGLIAATLLATLRVGAGRWGIGTHFAVLDVTEVMWPTSFWLLATNGREDSPQAWSIVGMAIAANVVLYALLGGIASTFRRTVPPTPRVP